MLLAVAVLLLFQTAPAQAQAPTTVQLSVGLATNSATEDVEDFTVSATLNRAATTTVTVTLTATGTATATSDYSLPAAFTIAVGATSAEGTITIVDDDIDEENETIVFSATTSPSLTVTGVTATIIDNDTAGVTFSSRGRIVAAGSTTTYTVKLDSEPTGNVTIAPTSGSPAAATVSPASRTFTSQNWQTPQTFTVTGVASGTSTITHVATTSDSRYSSLSIGSVSVTVNDADTVALVSNINQTQASRGGFAFAHAQAFTTGTNSGGYTLDSIEANLHVFSGQEAVLASNVGTIRAELWSDSSGAPNAKLADLQVPSNIVAGDNAFKAPLNTTLAASTTYHVVIYSTNANLNGRVALNNTTTNNEDSGAAAGWSIADTSHYVNANTPSGGSWLSFAAERRIRVKGYANTISTLIANTGQTKQAAGNALSYTQANAFTTGGNAGGYTLTGIDFHVTATSSLTSTHLGTLTASVWTAGAGALSGTSISDLGTKLADLTVPTSATTGVVTFAAPAGIKLAANTTYYVAIGSADFTGDPNLLINTTTSDNEDSGGTTGFSIANVSYSILAGQWGENGSSVSLTFGVKGYARQANTPAAPTMLSAEAGNGSLALSWTAPAGTPTAYHVHYTYAPTSGTGMVANNAAASGNNPATAWVAAARSTEMSPPTASQTLSSLDNGRTYRWRVRGVNGNGNGAWAFGTGTPVLALAWNLATNSITEGSSFGQRIQTGTQAAISGTLSFAVGDTNPASLSADLGDNYPTTFSASAGAAFLNMPQIPTAADTVNEEDETFKITFNAGTGYTVGTPATIVITITDNDPPAAPGGLSLTAGAQKLSASWSKPVGPVTGYQLRYKVTTATNQTATTPGDPSTGWVTVTPTGTSTSAEITGLTNGTAYHVQVRANDGQTRSGNGWGDWSASQSGTPTATPAAGVTVSETSVSVVAGSTTTYTIKLNKAPTANVVVTPTSGTTGVATVSGGLTFTTTNWSQTQNVTVTGVTAGTSTITHAATSTDTAYNSISIASVTATVTAATQTAPTTLTLTTNAASNTVAEDGGSVTVTATLNRAATTAVSVTLTATGTATGTADYSLPAAFTIPVGSTSATGTVTIVDDDLDEANETVILTTTVSGLTVTPVTLTITDDDTAGVTVSETTRSVQAAATTTYTVVLDSKPTANVVVGATSGTPANATVSPASRTFTPANWDTPQSFTVTGVQAGSSTITHAATSTDAKYPSSLSIGSVQVTVTAQPPTTLQLTTSAASNTVAENGGTVTVTATLNRAATTAVSVTLTATGTATATADYSLPSAFTIPVGSTSATGTLTIVNDAVDEENETVILTTSVSGLTVTGVTLTITDDDTAGVTVSQTTRDVQDGATTTYTVVLDSKPAAHVVVGATSGTPARATVSPASRTFSTTNWNTPQTFTVTGVASGSSTITHAVTSSGDSQYPTSLSIASVAVRVNPHDTTLSALSFSFSADGGQTFPGSGKLSPEFDPATRTYTIEISPSATHVKFTPTANHPEATITVNGMTTASGESSAAIPVSAGRVDVDVTAASRNFVETYRFVLSSGGGGAAGQLGNTVWTSVLVMRDLDPNESGGFLGCHNSSSFAAGDRCNSTPTLSEDTFYFAGAPGWSATDAENRGDNDWRASRQYGGVRIDALYTENQGANVPRKLVLSFTQNVPESLRQSLTLVFDGRSFPLREGVTPQNSPTAIEWSDTGIARNEHLDDQVVDVGLYLSPVGPSVTEWQPTMRARTMDGGKAGCGGDIDCGDPVVFGGNRFSVDAPKYGGLRSYRITELSVEVVARYGHDEVYRRVRLSVEEGGGTVELNGTTLELTANGRSIRLPIRIQNRVGNSNTWVWELEKSDALSWGPYSTVGVRIIPVTTGLQTVRVYYDEMKNGQPLDDFIRWDIARAKPHATLDEALIAVIPGHFVSLNTGEQATTTHARLLLRGDWAGSTITYGVGTYDQPPTSFIAVGAGGLTGAIPLNAEKSNTYVWVKVTNGDQVHTHLVIIDPPPRTFEVTPELSLTEGETGRVTVSLGSPATRGGVSFKVTTAYGDGGATANDIGEIVSTVTIPEGQRSVRIAVPTVDDAAVEDDESLSVTLSHVGEPLWAVEPGKTGTATVTIKDNDEPPEGPEPWNIEVVPGDGTLTVTWRVASRDGYEDSEIWHVLRWSQQFGVWANPRDWRAVGRNDGLSVDPGVASYTITGLKNGVATGVWIRSMVGYRSNMSERDAASSQWVRTKGVHTTPVGSANGAPRLANPIADAAIANERGTHHVPLAGVFTVGGGGDLTITASSSNQAVATVAASADGSSLTVTARARGTAQITVTASDGEREASDTFTVTVKTAPRVASAIADIGSLATGTSREVALSRVFADADNDRLRLSASSSATTVATVSLASGGSSLTVTGVAEGKATITVTARDPDGNQVGDTFEVTVTPPPNQAPTVASAIADTTIEREGGAKRVSLAGVFSDADGDDLTITAKSSAPAVATVTVASDQSSLTVTARKSGTATITVTADDGNDGSVSDAFTVAIATNAAPTVASPIADLSGLRVDDARRVSLAGVFSDADNDKLTITAKSSDTAVATVSVAADQSSLTLTAKQSGAATITVTADDGNGETVSDSFTATVQANNSPTVAAAITDIGGLRADDTRRISLSGVFTDDDGDSLTITAASSDPAVATVSVDAGQSSLTLTAKQAGTATITVRADDGNGETVSDSFTVTVAANSAPTVASALGAISELREGGTHQVSLSGVFSDADNDALTISAGSSNDGVATATVNAGGGSLTVTAKQAGTATITVTADDGNGGRTSTTFTVTVEAEPEPQPEPEPEAETPASSSTEEQDVVARYDANGDGVISYSEYLAAVADVGKGVTYADLVLIRQAWVDGGYKQ